MFEMVAEPCLSSGCSLHVLARHSHGGSPFKWLQSACRRLGTHTAEAGTVVESVAPSSISSTWTRRASISPGMRSLRLRLPMTLVQKMAKLNPAPSMNTLSHDSGCFVVLPAAPVLEPAGGPGGPGGPALPSRPS